MDGPDHYFSSSPASRDARSVITVRLRGATCEVSVAPGVFSPGRVDRGTAVLLNEAPDPPARGTFLDLGTGWGPLALTLARLSPDASVFAVDVNERALDLTRMNAAAQGLSIAVSTPDEVPPGVRFDLIWSNPPIRIGKAALHEMLTAWLPRLAPDGAAYLVVAKDLGADSLARWIESDLRLDCERVSTQKGFRLLRVTHRNSGSPAAT